MKRADYQSSSRPGFGSNPLHSFRHILQEENTKAAAGGVAIVKGLLSQLLEVTKFHFFLLARFLFRGMGKNQTATIFSRKEY